MNHVWLFSLCLCLTGEKGHTFLCTPRPSPTGVAILLVRVAVCFTLSSFLGPASSEAGQSSIQHQDPARLAICVKDLERNQQLIKASLGVTRYNSVFYFADALLELDRKFNCAVLKGTTMQDRTHMALREGKLWKRMLSHLHRMDVRTDGVRASSAQTLKNMMREATPSQRATPKKPDDDDSDSESASSVTTSSSQETDDTESLSVIGCDTPEGTESAGELPESGCEPMAMEDDEAAESDAESETRLAEALREADEILSSGEESKEEPVEGSEADEMSSGEESKAEEPEGELPVEESVEESAPYEGEPEEYDFERAAHRDELFSQSSEEACEEQHEHKFRTPLARMPSFLHTFEANVAATPPNPILPKDIPAKRRRASGAAKANDATKAKGKGNDAKAKGKGGGCKGKSIKGVKGKGKREKPTGKGSFAVHRGRAKAPSELPEESALPVVAGDALPVVAGDAQEKLPVSGPLPGGFQWSRGRRAASAEGLWPEAKAGGEVANEWNGWNFDELDLPEAARPLKVGHLLLLLRLLLVALLLIILHPLVLHLVILPTFHSMPIA